MLIVIIYYPYVIPNFIFAMGCKKKHLEDVSLMQ